MPSRPQWAHYPADRSCHRRHRHRLAVDHLRRLFDDPAGDQPRLSAAHEHRPYRRPGDRPDLCAVRQLGAGGRHARRRDRLRLVGRARGRLRHRGVAADGHHDADGDLRRAALEAQPSDRLPGQRRPSRSRPPVLRLDVDEAVRRRLVPPAHRLRHLVPHADLAQRRGAHGQGSAGGAGAFAGLPRTPPPRSAAPPSGLRHRPRPDDQGRAARPVAQRQLQPCPARKHVCSSR